MTRPLPLLMRVVLLPGIWPPDIGGPATHGPELAAHLTAAGHRVQVVTMASEEPTERPCEILTVPRSQPFPVRYSRLTALPPRTARSADVVYASATYAAAAAASAVARRPLVVKLVSDPAYERARRYGLFAGTLEEFQEDAGSRTVPALRRARTLALRRARRVVVPSRYLAEIALDWGLDPERVVVVPNPAPALLAEDPAVPEAPERRGLVFAGRITRQKALGTALEAIARVPGADLLVLGDGPDRERLERHATELGLNGRVRFAGSVPRAEVLRAFAAADALVLSSDWENFPHTAVEALALGTPLIATAVGGVPEIVVDGVNGLLVPPGSPDALAEAIGRFTGSAELRARARGGRAPVRRAPRGAARVRADRGAAPGGGGALSAELDQLPRVLMVGRTRYALPLPEWLARKFNALERQLDFRVLASAEEGSPTEDERFRLVPPSRFRLLDGVSFYLGFPFHVRRQIKEFRPEAIIAESPYTAAAAIVARWLVRGEKPQVIVEVHGDWRTATRLYGSPARKLLNPFADAVSRFAVRRSDAVRALSRYTESLVEDVRGIPVTASFEAYMDLSAFTAREVQPLPERPTALFVGMLEAYKNIDGLAAAWRLVAPDLPDARLVIVGKGARREVVEELVAELPEQVEWHEQIPPSEVAEQMDDATVLVLPSRSEGLGRVVVEAFARGRGLVASRVGGIPDVARDGEEALLVEPGDVEELAAALRTDPLRPGARRPARRGRAAPLPLLAHDAGRVRRAGPLARGRLARRRPRRRGAAARAPRRSRSRGRRRGEGPAGGDRPARARPRLARVAHAAVPSLRRRSPPAAGRDRRGVAVSRLRRPRRARVRAAWPAVAHRRDARGLARGDASLRLAGPADARAGRGPHRPLHAPARRRPARAVARITAGLAEREAGVPPLESFPTYSDLSAFMDRPPQPLPDEPTVALRRHARADEGDRDARRRLAAGRGGGAARAARHRRPRCPGRSRRPAPGRLPGRGRARRAAAAGRGRGAHGRRHVPRASVAQ